MFSLTPVQREEVAVNVIKAWKKRHKKLCVIDGGQDYSLAELLKFREARRKRLSSKYQNKKVR